MEFLGETAWRRLHMAVWMSLLVLLLAEASVGVPALWQDRLPTWGFDAKQTMGMARLDGRSTGAQVHQLTDPGLAEHLRVDDHVVFPRTADRWLVPEAGSTQTVVRQRKGTPDLSLELRATTRPFTANERFDYLFRLLMALPALILALLLARQRPLQPATRHLAWAFLGFAASPFLNFTFGHALAPQVVKPLVFAALPCAIYETMRFGMRYAEDFRHPLQPLLQRLLWPVRLLTLGCVLALLLYFNGQRLPVLGWLLSVSMGLVQAMALFALYMAHARSSGRARARTRFLIAAFVLGIAPVGLLLSAGERLPGFEAGPLGWPLLLLFGGQLLSYLGLGYAVLRHRVFDLYLARDRALVYGVALLLVTVVVLLLKFLLQTPLTALLSLLGDGMERKLVEAALAVAVYLSGHFTFHWLDHSVQHLVFRRRLHQAQQMRQFMREAQHIAGQEQLLRRFHEELERFSEQAGNVIYLRLAGGDFAQVFNSIPRAPHLLEGDDALLVRMRSDARPRWLEGSEHAQSGSDVVGALALPMQRRGQLAGLVVLGTRPDREAYRPEEVELLAEVVAHVALDLQAIAAARWEEAGMSGGTAAALGH